MQIAHNLNAFGPHSETTLGKEQVPHIEVPMSKAQRHGAELTAAPSTTVAIRDHSSPAYFDSTPPPHGHNAFDDMLNTELVAQDDCEITRAEQTERAAGARDQKQTDFGSPGFPTPGAFSTNTLSDPPSYEAGLGGKVRLHAKLMRPRETAAKVTNVELFFDLVFVYAISAIAESMEHHLTWEVVLEMLVVTLAWGWVFSAWTFNWFNPDSYLVRILLLALMLINLIMSSVIGESFTSRSLLFAIMYVLIQLGRTTIVVLALHGHRLQKNFIRVLIWFCVTAVLWLTGGVLGGVTRNVLWTVAIVLEYTSAAAGFYVPGLGKSISTDWDIHGGHLAERCSLFIIIALGESIVVTGEAFKGVFSGAAGLGVFIISFLGAAAMWWIYFHTASTEAVEFVERSNDPGKMGRLAYTYIHVLMVIGIIWCAVADRLSLEHPHAVPSHEGHRIYVVIMIGGPALFVLGHALFRKSFCARTPHAHFAAIAAFICATPIGLFLPVWATALTTTTILLLLAFYESYFRCVILPRHASHSE
ncbi:hypothetical protein BGZ70_002045 [Mortierella alpina]|uniref:Low temperature requirement A n=1 Tax=Mortierella alpina TaxID=64518 RepID=A0A9P6IV85_MORAP|nr:hypothetical protein BGZ70_002045 [Mortierella alpina]